MREELTPTETQVMDVLGDVDTATIRDFVEAGLRRGRPLQETLRTMEANGLLVSRLPKATSPLRLYEMCF